MRSPWLVVSALIAGCAGAAPSGFSKGDRWSVPLVGPLEGGHVLVPASVEGKGPYLFLIDPDSPITVVDQQVIDEARLRQVPGPSMVDEAHVEQSRGYAELRELKLGDLTVASLRVMAVPRDFYNVEGRRVQGVIGRDVVSDRLVYGIDRDQGLVTLATPAVFKPPAGATPLAYRRTEIDTSESELAGGDPMTSSNNDDASRIGVKTHTSAPPVDVKPVPRRVVDAQLGQARFRLHLDLGEPVSQLRPELWPKAQLAAAEAELRLVDEAATVRTLASAAPADASISAGAGSPVSGHVSVVPYIEKRFGPSKVDGALGLDFFRGYAVYASWPDTTYYLRPRGELASTSTARLGRWGADVPQCPHPGCAQVTLTQTDGGLKLDIARDPQAANRPLELYLAVSAGAGRTASNLIAELPAGSDTISGAVPGDYDEATITVQDVSAFTRPCAASGGCVFPVP